MSEVHDGEKKPIVLPDPAVHPLGMREEVQLVVKGPSGPVLVEGTAAGEVKVSGAGGGGGGASLADKATFVEGTTLFAPGGGVFNDGLPALTSGQAATQRITPRRAGHVNLRRDDGTEIGTAGAPVQVGDGGSSLTVDDGGSSLTVDGTVAVTQSTSPWVVAGGKSNNAGVPGSTNLGTLPAVATAAEPTYTEGNQVALSTDLNGNLRTRRRQPVTLRTTLAMSTTAYAKFDNVGGKITYANVAPAGGGAFIINKVAIANKDAEDDAFTIFFFRADPSASTITDNTALDINDADLFKLVARVRIEKADWEDINNKDTFYADVEANELITVDGTDLYVAVMTREAKTYTTTTDLQLEIGLLPAES